MSQFNDLSSAVIDSACTYNCMYVRHTEGPNEEEKQLNDLQEDRKIDPVSSKGWK